MWLHDKAGNSLAFGLGPIQREVMVFMHVASDETSVWLIKYLVSLRSSNCGSESNQQSKDHGIYNIGCSLLESPTSTVSP